MLQVILTNFEFGYDSQILFVRGNFFFILNYYLIGLLFQLQIMKNI